MVICFRMRCMVYRCVVYMACYFLLAVWTYGIQVPSGLFVPGIIIGCSFGRLTGEWVRYFHYDPLCASSDVFAGTRIVCPVISCCA